MGEEVTGAHSRRKGAEFERECARLLGYERNARNGIGDGDLKVPPESQYNFECKRRARGFKALYDAIAQAWSYDEGRIPVALVRDDRYRTLVVMRLDDIAWLLRARTPGDIYDPESIRQESDDMRQTMKDAMKEGE